MRLDPSDAIARIPILEVRRLFRTLNAGMRVEDVADQLDLEVRAARQLVDALQRLDLLALVSSNPDVWAPTVKGNALAGATALPPMTRKTAEGLLAKFLRRVQQINASEEYLYTVSRVDVFGSYLSNRPTLNDLDLAIELQPRESDPDKHFDACEAECRAAYAAGRRFPSYADQLGWPEEKVRRFLKARSPRLSLHGIDEPRQLGTSTKTLIEFSGRAS